MTRLFFILSCPKHHLYKGPDGLNREDLVFHNARIGKGIGQIVIAWEYHNGECGAQFATLWESKDVSAEDFYGNSVTIHNLNDALLSKMKMWNEQNPENKYTDSIIIDRGSLGLNTHVHLPTEQFSRLLQIDLWKDHFLKLALTTKQSFEGLKFALSEEEKNSLRRGDEDWYRHGSDSLSIEIENYEIEIEGQPHDMKKVATDPMPLHLLKRLLRSFIGR